MTTRSTAKKTLQNFHVRTALWNSFERRAQLMDCSTDYLINEAMRLYASTHGFLEGEEVDADNLASTGRRRPSDAVPNRVPPRPSSVARPRAQSAQPLPRPQRAPSGPAPRPTDPGGAFRPSRPPPPPRPRPSTTGAVEQRPVLVLIFQGRKIKISSDQFIIGRGAKSSDLVIKDANISRKHAAIIFHNATYYIKDLGSTNGVEYNGKTVDSKRIDEGDVFTICGYDLHFTYSA